MAGDPYGWWCAPCGCRHSSSACPGPNYTSPVGGAAGHCGKCGAPYTVDYLTGGTATKFVPTCKCWNV